MKSVETGQKTSLADLAQRIEAQVFCQGGGDDITIEGVGPIEAAQKGQVTFLVSPEYSKYLPKSAASAVIVKEAIDDCPLPQLIHTNPYWAFAKAAQWFYRPEALGKGISEQAVIDPSAKIGKDVCVMPFAVIGAGVKVGEGTTIGPGCYLHAGTTVGDDCFLWPHVVTQRAVSIGDRVLIHAGTVLGADGFGFAAGKDGHAKIPQAGSVVIGDDVEIGANSTIDCGTMSDTKIGSGTKIDSHAHVAHNVQVGEHGILCGMSAIAGSSKLGDWVTVGGNSCINNHVEVGSHVTLGGHSAITKNTKDPGLYLGFPAMDAGEWRKMIVRLRRMDKLEQRLKDLEKRLEEK